MGSVMETMKDSVMVTKMDSATGKEMGTGKKMGLEKDSGLEINLEKRNSMDYERPMGIKKEIEKVKYWGRQMDF